MYFVTVKMVMFMVMFSTN